VNTVIIGGDFILQLQENVQLAREFRPPSQQQMAALTAKTESVSKPSLFFRLLGTSLSTRKQSSQPVAVGATGRVPRRDGLERKRPRTTTAADKGFREPAGVGGLDDNQG